MDGLLQTLAESSVDQTLELLMSSSEVLYERNELENVFLDHGAQCPEKLFDRLLRANVFQAMGSKFGLSQNGRRLALLVSAINGADVDGVFRRIRRIDGKEQTYELVREGMTSRFFKSLVERPGFGSLYFCSPWINPSEKQASELIYATGRQRNRAGVAPGVFVITRPPNMQPGGAGDGLEPFRQVDAKIFYNKKLHSKLYIREPDPAGGVLLAIVGSQNLTRSSHLELGIMIRGDGQLVNQLITYFLDLSNRSEEG